MRYLAVAGALALTSCAGAATGILGDAGALSGKAATIFGLPAATIAKQMTMELVEIQGVAAALQMLKAQLDGQLPVIQNPPMVPPIVPTPVPTPDPGPITTVPPPPVP